MIYKIFDVKKNKQLESQAINGTVAKHPAGVIPAKLVLDLDRGAGIQDINGINGFWIPAFAGMTEKIISQQRLNIGLGEIFVADIGISAELIEQAAESNHV